MEEIGGCRVGGGGGRSSCNLFNMKHHMLPRHLCPHHGLRRGKWGRWWVESVKVALTGGCLKVQQVTLTLATQGWVRYRRLRPKTKVQGGVRDGKGGFGARKECWMRPRSLAGAELAMMCPLLELTDQIDRSITSIDPYQVTSRTK